MSERDLVGRRAIVGGASRGIGRAAAVALAARGASVTVLARDRTALEEGRDALPRLDDQKHAVLPVDYDDWRAVGGLVRREVGDDGPVHILVHNTGGPPGGRAVDAEPDAYETAFRHHLLAGQALVQAVVPGMQQAGWGRIVNIISTSVITPIRNLGVSNTIRGAVANWGRTLAVELGRDGITVNNVLPGFTDTDRLQALLAARAEREDRAPEAVIGDAISTIPAGRFAEPAEIAAVIAFLCSPSGGYVNGVNLPVDGGRLAGQ
jgi:3-oxoacyl-[acyl-carrier protein] reductase